MKMFTIMRRLVRPLLAAMVAFFLVQPSQAADLEITVLENGNGVVAELGMLVAVHYQGRLTDGTVFDDSHKRGEPISFTLGKGQVIPGWEQGIEGMTVGEKRVLTIPPELGYGAAGAGDVIPPNATLVFDVELVSAMVAPTLSDAMPQDLEKARESGTIIIDIRDESEWRATGIIDTAHTITGFTSMGGLHPEFQAKFTALVPEKDTPFILYCQAGSRTSMMGRALVEQLGYTQVSHLTTGIDGWLKYGAKTVPYQPQD